MSKLPSGWIAIPTKGSWAESSHPRTILNPDLYFVVTDVKQERDKYYARGLSTAWFNTSMLTPVDFSDVGLHGFDTTLFDHTRDFSAVLQEFSITYLGRDRDNYDCFVFGGPDVTIYTTGNPLTGEYHIKERRKNELGFAGYIGLTGKKDAVKACAAFIRNRAAHIKDESFDVRGFI